MLKKRLTKKELKVDFVKYMSLPILMEVKED